MKTCYSENQLSPWPAVSPKPPSDQAWGERFRELIRTGRIGYFENGDLTAGPGHRDPAIAARRPEVRNGVGPITRLFPGRCQSLFPGRTAVTEVRSPGDGRAARKDEPVETESSSTAAPDPQALRCAGCGAAGHPPVIVYARSEAPPGVVLTPVFGWHTDGRVALLCCSCKAKAAKARKTGRSAMMR